LNVRATFLSTDNLECIEQSLSYSEFMEDTYQLTVEEVKKHDSQIFIVTIFFIVRKKLRFSALPLSRSRVILDFSGNAVVINNPYDFGQFMHHSRMYHRKILRPSFRM
jgi:hypothetical protein